MFARKTFPGAYAVAVAMLIAVGMAAASPLGSFGRESKEDEPPSPTAPKLQALDPFLGEWDGVTETEVGQKPFHVKASYKKILNGSCIEYETEIRSGEDLMVSQRALIGWDKDTEMLKAWGFRSNGQRWESTWDPDKEKNPAPGTKVWVCEYVWRIPDGDNQTGTSIKTIKSKDSYTEVLIHRPGNGQEPMSLPVITFKRRK